MQAARSPWPAALVSGAIAVIVAVALSLGLAALSMPADATSGTVGRDGADGARGATGAPGRDGVNGRDGADGVDGAAGRDGVDGVPGAPGAPGVPGAPGADGVDGAPGAAGVPGAPGADGTDGVDGVDGLDAVVAYGEADTVVGVYSLPGGIHMSEAAMQITAGIAPGRYVLVLNLPRITHDIGIQQQPLDVHCRLTGAASVVTGAENFVFLPSSGVRTYSNGEGANTRGTIWDVTAVRAIDVTAESPIGVACWSAHSNSSLPAPDPSLVLHSPSAILLRG